MSWLDEATPVEPTQPEKKAAAPVAGSSSWLEEATPVSPNNQPAAAAPDWTADAKVVRDVPPPKGQDPEYEKVRKIIERPVMDANLFGSEITTDAELEAIARHHGVNPDDLKKNAEFFGARRTEADVPTVGRVTGFLGRAVGGIPQFVVKKTQDDPEYRKALDDVRDLADRKRSWGEFVAENIVPISAGRKVIKGATEGASLLTKAIPHAAQGATFGLGASKEGHELESATEGAAGGVVLGLGGEYVGKFLGRGAQKEAGAAAGKAVPEINTTVRTMQADVGGEVEKQLAHRAESEDIIAKRVLNPGKAEQLSQEEIDKIVSQQFRPDQLSVLTNPSTAEGRVLRRSLDDTEGQITNAAVKQKLAEDIVQDRQRSFARELTGSDTTPLLEDAQQTIAKQLERNPNTTEKYKDFVGIKAAGDVIEAKGLRATSQPGFAGRLFEFFSPNEYVARHIDDKYGRNIEGVLRNGSNEFNKSTFVLSKFRKANDELSDMADKLGIGDELRTNPGKWYDAQATGNLSKLSPPEQQFARKFAETAEMYRNEINSTGRLNVPRLENYVPKSIKSTQDLVPIVEQKLTQATEDASKLTGREIKDLGQLNNLELTQLETMSPATRDVTAYNRFVTGLDKQAPGELSGSLKESLYSSDGRRALELKANAAMERSGEGKIPDFMLEKDPFKLLDKWSMNTTRAAYLGDTVNKLRNEVRILKKLGADVDASTVEKMAHDILGPRKNTMAAATLNAKVGYQMHLDSLIDAVGGRGSVTGSFLNKLRVLPEVMNQALGQIYPNVLGMNPTSLVTNLAGHYVKMVPELGGSPYAIKLANEATAKGMWNFGKNLHIAEQIGNVPAEFIRNQNRAIAEGVQRSGLYKAGAKATEAMNKISMYLFQKTEEFNRGTAVELARQLTKDLTEGNKGAIAVVNNMPRSMRLFIQQNIRTNPDVVALETAKHFNTVIAQNYNKFSASEFARTAGPLFSAFTKWPSVALGQAAYEMRSRGIPGGLMRNMTLAGTPWLILKGIDYAMGARNDPDEDLRSDRTKLIIGQGGMSRHAPPGNIQNFLTGQFFTPPALQLVKKGVEQVNKPGAEPADVAKGVGGEAVKNFVPGAGILRFISSDLATLKTGKKPQGDNFFEKTQEGLNQLTK